MSHRKMIEDYYCDINNLTDILGKLTNSYRLLIGGASELNSVALAHKKDVKSAINRANKLGDTIDKIISSINKSSRCYADYCELKSQLIKDKIKIEYMANEINEDLFINDLDELYEEDNDGGHDNK
ncbi:hypothetical protein H2684_08605 [Clostridium sp. cel8]|jgi:hypothetical protein|uniref:hypothetical protein n=1 Tax=unclassified Clostridium TaxID=2614128 RepID=UPI0015F6D0A0|nr:hypothetical protein [Clostridium sp. cel8]MBA5851365.1 hypothetical protein [Clostridium sp. cel8]